MSTKDDDSLTTLTVTVRGPYLYSRATHSSLRDLKAELESDHYRVQIPIGYPHATPPPGAVYAALEHVIITIEHGAATVWKDTYPVVLTLAVKEIFDSVRRWLARRFEKNPDAPSNYTELLGPDGTPLKTFLAKSADDIKEIDPPPHY